MQDRVKRLLKEYSETILYLFYGVLTVVVNTMIYLGLTQLGFSDLIANTIAFFLAVQFAYFTNTKYVFRTEFTKKNFLQFWGMRIGTIFIDNMGLILFIKIGFNQLVSKIVVNIIIIAINYICSKFYIYKKRG